MHKLQLLVLGMYALVHYTQNTIYYINADVDAKYL